MKKLSHGGGTFPMQCFIHVHPCPSMLCDLWGSSSVDNRQHSKTRVHKKPPISRGSLVTGLNNQTNMPNNKGFFVCAKLFLRESILIHCLLPYVLVVSFISFRIRVIHLNVSSTFFSDSLFKIEHLFISFKKAIRTLPIGCPNLTFWFSIKHITLESILPSA